MVILQVNQLSIEVNNKKVLQDINLTIDEIGIYGLIGAKNSGKTILFEWLSGNLSTHTTELKIVKSTQKNPAEAILVNRNCLLMQNTAFDNLRISSKKGAEISEADIEWYLSFVGFEKMDWRRVSDFSKAEKDRLTIALALIENPTILLLDELFLNYTIDDLNQIYELLSKILKLNITIIMSSRNKELLKTICVAIFHISAGKLI